MFLASLSDLFVPDYTGKIIDAFMEENYEGPGGAMELLKQWMVILLFGVACTFVQTVHTAERFVYIATLSRTG